MALRSDILQMAFGENTYSRVVAGLKVILPLIAVAILLALFLVSRGYDTSGGIPYADIDVGELVREERMTAPVLTGLTPRGAALSITAETVRPDLTNPSVYRAEALVAQIDNGDGLPISMTAQSGVVYTDDQTAVVTGNVRLETPNGYRIDSDELTASLEAGEVVSPGPVDIASPFGPMTAGHMVLREIDGEPPTHEVVFTGGVRLVYVPRD